MNLFVHQKKLHFFLNLFADHSVLGALSLLNMAHTEPWSLYDGQPVRLLKPIEQAAAYFSRRVGYEE